MPKTQFCDSKTTGDSFHGKNLYPLNLEFISDFFKVRLGSFITYYPQGTNSS